MVSASAVIICFLLISYIRFGVDGGNITSLISEKLYNKLFPHKDDDACPAKGFFTYQSFIEATKRYPEFGNKGSLKTRKREIAAFLAQVSHETRAGAPTTAAGPPYDMGLCVKEVEDPGNGGYCQEETNGQFLWNCDTFKSYMGRGAMMIAWNLNYGPAGEALGYDILWYPELVSSNPVLAYQTALYIWMTQPMMPTFNISSPTCHDVMIGRYKLTQEDRTANRTIGYGLVSNIISNSILLGPECGGRNDTLVESRIGYYKRFAALFSVKTGPNLDCLHQKNYYYR